MANSNFKIKQYFMNQQKLNIIMFNMSKYSDWQKGVVNRNYHVLHNLVKKELVNKIIAVDFLPFTWQRGIKNYIKDQVLNDTLGSVVYGDLTSRCWQVSSKILVYTSIDSLINPQKVNQELKKITKEQGMNENLIVWNYNPLCINYFDQLNQKLNIFDAVDDWLSHSSYKKYRKKLKQNYQIIKKKSDLIFTVSKYLKEETFANQSNAHWLPNAVDLEFFQNETNISQRLKDLPSPIIGFLGILQDRIDTGILLYLAKNNPEKSIVLAGPIWSEFPKNKFKKLKNVHFLGPIPHTEIPSLYNGFDVGIIPYKTNEFIKSTDPMKFYEYIAAKLPIVSTSVAGLNRFSELIQTASSQKKFNKLVNQAISEGKEKLSQEKIDVLKNNTWQYRVGQMLNLIFDQLK